MFENSQTLVLKMAYPLRLALDIGHLSHNAVEIYIRDKTAYSLVGNQ